MKKDLLTESPDKKDIPECLGERKEAYPKCEDCDYIEPCSLVTLSRAFKNVRIIT